MVLIEGPGPLMGGTELDALIAQTLNVPVLMTIKGRPRMSAGDYFNLAVGLHASPCLSCMLHHACWQDEHTCIGVLTSGASLSPGRMKFRCGWKQPSHESSGRPAHP